MGFWGLLGRFCGGPGASWVPPVGPGGLLEASWGAAWLPGRVAGGLAGGRRGWPGVWPGARPVGWGGPAWRWGERPGHEGVWP